MSVFSSSQKKRLKEIEAIQEWNDRIFSVFTETQKNCQSLVDNINEKIKDRNVEIASLQHEVRTLEETKKMNDSLHNKISQFLNS